MAVPKKKTVMILKVDLQCPCCYKKIQKILCKIPQISDRFFDEKANKVTISVICCNPEKIRDKLYCKGGKIIKCIEIIEPPKPAPPPKPKEPEKPKQPEKPKEPEKPKQPEKPKEPEKPKQPEKPKEPEKPKQPEKPKEPEKPKQPEKPKEPEKPKQPVCPGNICCRPCYEGCRGGPCCECCRGRPCFHGHGFPLPPPPQPCYDGSYPCGPGYVYGRPCCVTRCDFYSEENPTGCTIM